MSTGVLSPEVKRQGCEVDHSPPFTAEIKNEWNCTSMPSMCGQWQLDIYLATLLQTGACVSMHLHSFKVIHPIVYCTTKDE